MNSILLHACCAPCATYVIEWLQDNGYNITGFFYNPNIFPVEEYQKRKKCMGEYLKLVKMPAVFVENDVQTAAGNCLACYEKRLWTTANYGKNNGFSFFSTTLLISPFQKHDLIKEIGLRIGEELGIEFFYYDFREGYKRSRDLSLKNNLYRQKYCGCLESKIKREEKDEQIA
ncbi:MAG: hypothetical protein FD145_497 [Candidatus Saganbacteria bacterium]|uniref:Epoxyqueuosine reductase QueH n=1 Tax=Candidatus Saganbacteria bacterium TaxID=2575572 RepID=A0A833L1M7_UNCSA|nr:MAG: hypothetical protein FD145_497 [Candidatus Saganbacteria bacterium]